MHASATQFYQSRATTELGEAQDEATTALKILNERNFSLVFRVHNSTKDSLTRNYKRPGEKTRITHPANNSESQLIRPEMGHFPHSFIETNDHGNHNS